MTGKTKPFTGRIIIVLLVIACLPLVGCRDELTARKECPPTPYDEIGPFYRPGAPVRESVGQGYLLTGSVLSAGNCRPLAGARIEFWLVNPQGQYDDAHRATVHADSRGRYRFESPPPGNYGSRKPHIHIMVSADNHERLITQHYPEENTTEAIFDLVLVPVVKR